MNFAVMILVAALVFGVCFLLDKGFTKLFRSSQQHKSGLSVRFRKRYGTIGVIVFVLGVAALLSGLNGDMLMIVCGALLLAGSIFLLVYYMTFGIYYDDEAFVYTKFGKSTRTYAYKDIKTQQLYNSYGNIIIELHMADGSAVQVQSTMDGAYPFLDKAFSCWLTQTGRVREECAFHDPQNSCWFPSAGE